MQTSLVSILFVSIMSSKRLKGMSSRHVFKTSSRHDFKTSSGRLQRNNFSFYKTNVFKTSCKMSWRRLQGDFKKFSRHLQDVLEDVKLLHWRRLQDILKTSLEDVFKTSSRPTNIYWSFIKTLRSFNVHKITKFPNSCFSSLRIPMNWCLQCSKEIKNW